MNDTFEFYVNECKRLSEELKKEKSKTIDYIFNSVSTLPGTLYVPGGPYKEGFNSCKQQVIELLKRAKQE